MRNPFFTERARALLREINEINLTDLATLYVVTPGVRAPGGVYPTTEVILETGVKCRLVPSSLRLPLDISVAAQFGPDVKWGVIFEAGKDVPATTRLIITGSSKGVPWTQHLQAIAQIVKESEMYRLVACSDLPVAKR